MPYPNPPAATYSNGNDVEHSFLNSFAQPGLQPPNEEFASSFTRSDILRAQSDFSPFSPEPNKLYASSESMKRDLNSCLRFDSLPHPSKAFAPGFFPQPQDMKLDASLNAAESKLPTSVRPSVVSRATFAENTDPLAIVDAGHGRAEAPISRPNSGKPVRLAEKRDPDSIHDLNGTLANLDLDRPWRSPEAKGRHFC